MNIQTSHQDILKDEIKSFAYLATLMPDGSPQVTPVWFSWDGQNLYINTARGRVKDRNMIERPEVAVVIPDPRDPYRYIHLRGRVVEEKGIDARAHINELSKKYTGNSDYQGSPGEVRVTYRLDAERVSVYG